MKTIKFKSLKLLPKLPLPYLPRKRFPWGSERRERHLEELVHAVDALDKILEFSVEDVGAVTENSLIVGLPSRDQVQLLLHCRSHARQDKVSINLKTPKNILQFRKRLPYFNFCIF